MRRARRRPARGSVIDRARRRCGRRGRSHRQRPLHRRRRAGCDDLPRLALGANHACRGYPLVSRRLCGLPASHGTEAVRPKRYISRLSYRALRGSAASRAAIRSQALPVACNSVGLPRGSAGAGKLSVDLTEALSIKASKRSPIPINEVAADFPMHRTCDLDMAAAQELAAELGALPLALEQAAAYIQATGTTLTEARSSLARSTEEAGHAPANLLLGLIMRTPSVPCQPTDWYGPVPSAMRATALGAGSPPTFAW